MAEQRLQVAVGILHDERGQLLVQQRRKGTVCAGQWEFPGGKLEAGETPQAALIRELAEELGIEINQVEFLCCYEHDYTHANVSLHTYLVHEWSGVARGIEGQQLAWGAPAQLLKFDLLEAAYPLLAQAVERMGGIGV